MTSVRVVAHSIVAPDLTNERSDIERASPFSDSRLWLAAIVLSGAILRLWGLEVQSLWGDELYVQHLAALPSVRQMVAVLAAEDVHPPGFPLLIYFAGKLVGDSEAMLRLPSALAGIAAVPAMFLLGRSLCSTRVGLLAAALAAASWFPIYYSQECRAYSLLFLGAASLGWQIAELERRHGAGLPGVRAFAIAAFFTALAMSYMHYFGLLFVALAAALLFYLALCKRLALRPLAFVCAALVISYSPWLATLLAQYGRGKIWIAQPKLASLLKPYAAMSNDYIVWLFALLLTGAAIGAFGTWVRREPWLGLRNPRGRAVLLASAWAALPTLVAFAVSRLLLPVFTERNLIIALPGVLLLAALALDEIERRLFRGIAVPSLLLVGLLLGDLIAVRNYYTRPTKHRFREAALRVIEENAGAKERPLIVAEVWYASYFDYYFRSLGSDLRVDVVPRTMDDRRIVATTRPSNLWRLELPPKPRATGRSALSTYRGYREAGRWLLHGWVVRQLRPRDYVGTPLR